MKINAKKLIHNLVLVFWVALFFFNFGKLIYSCIGYYQAQNEYYGLYETATTSASSQVEVIDENIDMTINYTTRPNYSVPDFRVDFDELIATNSDCVGWIYVPSIDISYPVVQSKDNKEYLTKTFYGKKNNSGCIFNDATIDSAFRQKTILYGHNMKDGSMFAKLYDLTGDEDIWIYMTDGSIRHYVITEIRDTDTSDTEIYSVDGSVDTLILSTCIKGLKRHVIVTQRDYTFL